MSIHKLIVHRRSIRRFKQQTIPYSVLTKLVNAARLMPSAANLQPLEYVIIDDAGQVAKVFETLQWARYISPLGTPPQGEEPVAYVIVLANTNIKADGYQYDVGAAMENMILTALSDGIGSCWLSSIDREAMTACLKLPAHLTVCCVLALGYPNEQPVMEELTATDGSIKYWKDKDGCLHVPKRRLEQITHYNQYGTECPETVACEDWEALFETSVEEEAYILQGFLQNNEIPCVLEAAKSHIYPVNFGSMSKIRLLVPEDRLDEARGLLEKMVLETDETEELFEPEPEQGNL
ncbi:MAG: nitroreductase family protein [Candidatus Schekmanbacteria bacterium]|nr:nitroreductase family protein [Candidatus Schekmanbacteria bacterium]